MLGIHHLTNSPYHFILVILSTWVLIFPRLADLFDLNYKPLLKLIEGDIQRWINLLLNLIGQIASIKMKVLPCVMYLFSMLPVTPPEKWFKSLDSIVTQFYWKKK